MKTFKADCVITTDDTDWLGVPVTEASVSKAIRDGLRAIGTDTNVFNLNVVEGNWET